MSLWVFAAEVSVMIACESMKSAPQAHLSQSLYKIFLDEPVCCLLTGLLACWLAGSAGLLPWLACFASILACWLTGKLSDNVSKNQESQWSGRSGPEGWVLESTGALGCDAIRHR